ncbi:MAG TPA: VTT domain-containing protein [Thermoleophilaceae bacterium]|nr:VTT domain-containing protein [Thermoleophilaceae bacterium]
MVSDLARLLTGALARSGLLALVVLPLPPEVLLPFAGFQVARGELSFVASLAAATSASVVAAVPLYVAARVGGRPMLLRHGRLLRLTEERLARAERWFGRWGEATVLFGRMVTGARSLVSVPAGLARMALGRFLLWTALGFGSWNALLLGAGWILGERWERVSHVLGAAGPVVGVLLASAAVGLVIRRRRASRRPPLRVSTSG